MAWTYSGDPGSSKKDEVRFLIGDTNECFPYLQDGEITWMLTQYNQCALQTSIRLCETLMAKFAGYIDETVGSVSLKNSQLLTNFTKLRDELRQRLLLQGIAPYAGGISKADKKTQAQNPDRVKPDFTKHMMENEQLAPWTTENANPYDDPEGD